MIENFHSLSLTTGEFAFGEVETIVFQILTISSSCSDSLALLLSEPSEGKPTLLRRWKCILVGDVFVLLCDLAVRFPQHCNGLHLPLFVEHLYWQSSFATWSAV